MEFKYIRTICTKEKSERQRYSSSEDLGNLNCRLTSKIVWTVTLLNDLTNLCSKSRGNK